jgi:hypothetical protein
VFPLKDLNILKIKEEDLATPRVITGRYNLFPRTSGGKYTLFKNNFDRIKKEGHDFLYRDGVLYVWYKEGE